MSQRLLKFIVIFLAILICLCFFGLVYGFYIKIAKKQINLDDSYIGYNLNLDKSEEIIDIDLINNKKILFTIKNKNKTYAIIYDIDTHNIVKIDKAK
tara:strand:+ start:148 stop:438 length:291 start_codon:yes stop_codon:yes gene_type:complete